MLNTCPLMNDQFFLTQNHTTKYNHEVFIGNLLREDLQSFEQKIN